MTGFKMNDSNIEFSWVLCSTFHDVGYPVQQFDSWMNSFFRDFLYAENIPTNVAFGNILLTRNFMEYIDKLASLLTFADGRNRERNEWIYNTNNTFDSGIRSFLMKKLIEDRNHGIISSLCLLDRIENSKYAKETQGYKKGIFSSSVLPAALAIALHDKDIFSDEVIGKIHFETNPLAFLLIYSDTVQEWGRPSKIKFDRTEKFDPILLDVKFNEDEVLAILSYRENAYYVDSNGDKKYYYNEKCEEVKNVFKNIKSINVIFKIELRNEKTDDPPLTFSSE